MTSEENFTKLDMPSMTFTSNPSGKYLVYKNAKEFVEVEAHTAFEALKKSGIEKPYKIYHENDKDNFIIEYDELKAINNDEAPTDLKVSSAEAPDAPQNVTDTSQQEAPKSE